MHREGWAPLIVLWQRRSAAVWLLIGVLALTTMAFGLFGAIGACSEVLALKRNVREAIERVAARLGNTPTICRKCYIHPEIFASYSEGSLLLEIKKQVEAELRDQLSTFRPEEAAVLTLLQTRLSKTLKEKLTDSLEEAA